VGDSRLVGMVRQSLCQMVLRSAQVESLWAETAFRHFRQPSQPRVGHPERVRSRIALPGARSVL